MSLLWRDEVGIYLSPWRVCLVRLSRGLRPKVTAEHEQAIESSAHGGWAAASPVLEQCLSQPAWQGAHARIVLADHWVRYAVVPWEASLASADERLTHARQLLISIYGEVVSDWDLRLSETRPQCPRVVCAIPTALVSGLRAACETRALKVTSLQPQLIASYEIWRSRLPAGNAWFVTIEQGSLAAARICADGWDRVHSVRIGSDWARELKRLQTFGRLASQAPDEGSVYIDAPHAWREVAHSATAPAEANTSLHWLDQEEGPVTTLQRLCRARRMAA